MRSKSLPGFGGLLKGLRRGEITVLTGTSGVGKTTILSQLALDYCANSDVRTLFGSFEIQNTMIIRKMLSQYGRLNFDAGEEENRKLVEDGTFDRVCSSFSTLPLWFLKVRPSQSIYQSIYVSVCLSIYLSICLSIPTSISISISISTPPYPRPV